MAKLAQESWWKVMISVPVGLPKNCVQYCINVPKNIWLQMKSDVTSVSVSISLPTFCHCCETRTSVFHTVCRIPAILQQMNISKILNYKKCNIKILEYYNQYNISKCNITISVIITINNAIFKEIINEIVNYPTSSYVLN